MQGHPNGGFNRMPTFVQPPQQQPPQGFPPPGPHNMQHQPHPGAYGAAEGHPQQQQPPQLHSGLPMPPRGPMPPMLGQQPVPQQQPGGPPQDVGFYQNGPPPQQQQMHGNAPPPMGFNPRPQGPPRLLPMGGVVVASAGPQGPSAFNQPPAGFNPPPRGPPMTDPQQPDQAQEPPAYQPPPHQPPPMHNQYQGPPMGQQHQQHFGGAPPQMVYQHNQAPPPMNYQRPPPMGMNNPHGRPPAFMGFPRQPPQGQFFNPMQGAQHMQRGPPPVSLTTIAQNQPAPVSLMDATGLAALALTGVNVAVSKLPLDMDNAYVMDVLRCAGRVVKWNRATDADTGKPKGFGFATYRTAEEAGIAVKILHDVELMGAKIQVKAGKKEQAIIEQKLAEGGAKYELQEKNARTRLEALVAQREGPPPEVTPADADAIIADIVEGATAGAEAKEGESETAAKSSTETPITIPPGFGRGRRMRNSGIMPALRVGEDGEFEQGVTLETAQLAFSEAVKFRQRQEIKDKHDEEQRKIELQRRLRQAQRAEEDRIAAEKAAAEAEAAREARIKAREEAAKAEEGKEGTDGTEKRDRSSRDKEGSSRRDGSKRRRSRSRSRHGSREKDRESRRERRHRSGSREKERSSKRRSGENDETDEDKQRRKQEEAEAQIRREQAEALQRQKDLVEQQRNARRQVAQRMAVLKALGEDIDFAEMEEDVPAVAEVAAEVADKEEWKKALESAAELRKQAKRQAEEQAIEKEKAAERARKVKSDAADKVIADDKAAAALAQAAEITRQASADSLLSSTDETSNTSKKRSLGFSLGSSKSAKTSGPSAAFGGDDNEEQKPVREVVPIDYGEPPVEEAPVGSLAWRKQKEKELVDTIPKDKEGLFNYKLDWAAIGGGPSKSTVTQKMRPWVVRKVREYLGEEEPTLIDFICQKLEQRASPQSMLEELRLVLEEDAEVFTIKMWRMLIFCSLRASSGMV